MKHVYMHQIISQPTCYTIYICNLVMHVNPLLTVYMWICFPGLTTLIFWVRMCRCRVKIWTKFMCLHEYGAPEFDSFDQLLKMFHSPYLSVAYCIHVDLLSWVNYLDLLDADVSI
jgi:hypothetical protein